MTQMTDMTRASAAVRCAPSSPGTGGTDLLIEATEARTVRLGPGLTKFRPGEGLSATKRAELAAAIDEFFGGFEKFQAHFTAAATGIQGSGWAVLSWDPIGEQLIIQQLFDQQANTAMGTVPIFQLDMWEHAFYLDYLNVKADYVKAVWNIANWQNVAQRFDAAREKTSGLLVLS